MYAILNLSLTDSRLHDYLRNSRQHRMSASPNVYRVRHGYFSVYRDLTLVTWLDSQAIDPLCLSSTLATRATIVLSPSSEVHHISAHVCQMPGA